MQENREAAFNAAIAMYTYYAMSARRECLRKGEVEQDEFYRFRYFMHHMNYLRDRRDDPSYMSRD